VSKRYNVKSFFYIVACVRACVRVCVRRREQITHRRATLGAFHLMPQIDTNHSV